SLHAALPIFGIGLVGKRLPVDGKQSGLAAFVLVTAVGVQTRRRSVGFPRRKRPLQSALRLDPFIGHSGIVAKPSTRNPLPLVERIGGRGPTRKQLAAATEPVRQSQKDVKIAARFRRWFHGLVDLSDPALAVGEGAFLLAPNGGG